MSEEDRDLMRLAAKAIGVQIEFLSHANGLESVVAEHEDPGKHVTDGYMWNPLEDDGDALRLAVLLNLHVQIDFNEDPAAVYIYGGWMGEGIEESIEECRFKAVRRAIVRAAAEIAKATA